MTSCIHSYKQQFSQIFNGKPLAGLMVIKKPDGLSGVQAFTQSPDHNRFVAEVVSHISECRSSIILYSRPKVVAISHYHNCPYYPS